MLAVTIVVSLILMLAVLETFEPETHTAMVVPRAWNIAEDKP